MFNDNRKGTELTMNMIVMAAIALLILLILGFLLMKSVGGWNKGTQCEPEHGKCAPEKIACSVSLPDYPVSSPFTCGKDQKCCVKIGG